MRKKLFIFFNIFMLSVIVHLFITLKRQYKANEELNEIIKENIIKDSIIICNKEIIEEIKDSISQSNPR